MSPPAATPADGAAGRRPLIAAWVFLAALIAAESAAALIFKQSLWGLASYAFLPPALLAIGIVLAPLAALAAPAFAKRRGIGAPRAGWDAALLALLALGAGALFWWFRSRTILLGDGLPITLDLPAEFGVHPREPLSGLLQRWVYGAFHGLFAAPGMPGYRQVWDAVALGSCLTGAAFVGVLFLLAREIVRIRGREQPRGPLTALCFLVLVAQGYIQLAFGYVENYTFGLLGVAIFLLAGLRVLRGRWPLIVPLAAAALLVALHFALAALVPAVLVVIAAALRDPARRPRAARDLAIAGAALLAIRWIVLDRLGFRLETAIGSLAASGRSSWSYLFSLRHLRDFLSEHVLIGPVGLVALLPALALFAPRPWRAGTVFVLAAALPAALACWLVPDLPLGYARDWDLFAPFGLAFAAAVLALVAGACETRPATRVLGVLLAASLFHTVPWIAVNASAERSLRRFETLPLGLGRTESTIAYWHYVQGDREAARSWLRRSLDAWPSNNRAHALFGEIFLEENRPAEAAVAFRAAASLRPDLARYRRGLIESLVRSGDSRTAVDEARSLAAMDSADVHSAALLALVLLSRGERDAARSALAAGASRAPGEPLYGWLDRQIAAGALSAQDSLLWWSFALGRAPREAAPGAPSR